MAFNQVRLRVKELAEALNVESADVISVCTLLDIQATSALTSLGLKECKKITDFYENNKKVKN